MTKMKRFISSCSLLIFCMMEEVTAALSMTTNIIITTPSVLFLLHSLLIISVSYLAKLSVFSEGLG